MLLLTFEATISNLLPQFHKICLPNEREFICSHICDNGMLLIGCVSLKLLFVLANKTTIAICEIKWTSVYKITLCSNNSHLGRLVFSFVFSPGVSLVF